MEDLTSLARYDEELAERVLSAPWMWTYVRGGPSSYSNGLNTIKWIAIRDVALARHVVALPWVAEAEQMTSHQWEPLGSLGHVAELDPGLAWQMVDFISSQPDRYIRRVLGNLSHLSERPDMYLELQRQAWFNDGLSAPEVAFLATTEDIVRHAPIEFTEMVETRFTQSVTTELPLAGEVNVWVIQKVPFPDGEELAETVAEAARAMEEIMGVPFPVSDLVVLVIATEPNTEYKEPSTFFRYSLAITCTCRLSRENSEVWLNSN